MSKISEAVDLAKKWAADPSHGYDQTSRWGNDYDCSSFLISVWEAVGVPVKSNGATYTGNMRSVFTRCGFVIAPVDEWDLTIGAQLEAGDVLLNDANHTAMYIGNGQLVQASANEFGGVTGGRTGDQTGAEIAVKRYYNFPWDCVLRYKDVSISESTTEDGVYTVKSGDSWWGIAAKELGNGELWEQLMKLNGKSIYDTIHPGDVIMLWDDGCKDCQIDPNAERKAFLENEVAKLGGKITWNA